MQTPQDPLIGTMMGNYQIVSELGRGGMGVVYKALQHSLNRTVAIKVLSAHLSHDEEFVKRFLREARLAAELNHPNVVTIHDVGQHNSHYFIAMEHIRGASLASLLRNGPLKPNRALHIAYQAATALAAAHARMIIHRDIKPDNIMVDPEGRVKVTDFGLAKAITSNSNFTATGALLGTPLYMSPEQCRAEEVNTRSDIYSLGVVMFEMLVGKAPFTADTPFVTMRQIVENDFPAPSSIRRDIPESIDRLVLKMVAKDPASRCISAEAAAKDIAKCARSLRAQASASASAAVPADEAVTVFEGTGSQSGDLVSSLVKPMKPPPQSGTVPEAGEPASGRMKSIRLAGVAGLGLIIALAGLWRFLPGGSEGESPPEPAVESGPLTIAASDIPLGAGIKATFRDLDTGEAFVFHQVSHTNRGGQDYYTVDTPFGKIYQTMRADGLYDYLRFAESLPAAVIQFPLSVGDRWTGTVTTDRTAPNNYKEVRHYYADAEDRLDTPHGVLTAIRVLYGTEEDLEYSPTAKARWYAPELGLVKMRWPGRQINAELESFERGDPPQPTRPVPSMIRSFAQTTARDLVIRASDMPLAAGTVTYMRTIGNPNWNVQFNQVEHIDKGGERFYAVNTPYGWTYHCMREDGLYEYLMFDQEHAEMFVPLPLAVGMKWSITSARGWKDSEAEMRYYLADAEEVLETEAGPIRAIRVVIAENSDLKYDPETSPARWYAQEKGLVKFNAPAPGTDRVIPWEITSLRRPN